MWCDVLEVAVTDADVQAILRDIPPEALQEVLEYEDFSPAKAEQIQRVLHRTRAGDECRQVYEAVTADCPLQLGLKLSRHFLTASGKPPPGLLDSDLVYGEIPYDSFVVLIDKLASCTGGDAALGGVFYDLGSGTGKVVIAAALLGHFSRVCGIECQADLHHQALKLKAAWHGTPAAIARRPAVAVEFREGELQAADWADATVCLANCLCFSPALLEAMGRQASSMAAGSFFITSGFPLPCTDFEVVAEAMLEHPYYIQRRLPTEP